MSKHRQSISIRGRLDNRDVLPPGGQAAGKPTKYGADRLGLKAEVEADEQLPGAADSQQGAGPQPGAEKNQIVPAQETLRPLPPTEQEKTAGGSPSSHASARVGFLLPDLSGRGHAQEQVEPDPQYSIRQALDEIRRIKTQAASRGELAERAVASPTLAPERLHSIRFGHRNLLIACAVCATLLVLLFWALWPSDSEPPRSAAAAPPAAPAREPSQERDANQPKIVFTPARAQPAPPRDLSARSAPKTFNPPRADENDASQAGVSGSRPATAAGASAQPLPTLAPPAGVPDPAPSQPRYIPCPAGYVCTGIMRLGDSTLANINGGFYAKGETVAQATVVEIEEFVVLMENDAGRFRLPVGASPVGPAPAGAPKDEQSTTEPADSQDKTGQPAEASK